MGGTQRGDVNLIISGLRILVGLAFIFCVMVVFVPPMLVMLPSRRHRIYLGNAAGKLISRAVLFLSGTDMDFSVTAQAQRHYPAIYISNHTSILDIFIGIWTAPYGVCGVAKKQVVYYPFFGLLYLLGGHLRIDRSNTAKAVEALKDVAVLMKRHNLGLWLWPEGTRSRDGKIKDFKKGFAHMALATGLPVVPVVVSGVQRAWRHGSWTIHPTKVRVQVLDPIYPTDWTTENLDEKVKMVHDRMEAALPPEQRSASRASALDFPETDLRMQEAPAR
jgi:1-acyl-sn-glycerol-3-phosphate acyltransferase